MDRLRQELIIEQLDNKIYKLKWYAQQSTPGEGWVNAIRVGLNMTLKQLGKKLGVSTQGAKAIETREQEQALTLGKMEEIAAALDMKFVYGFVPNAGSLQKHIEKRAKELATQIVMQTSGSMSLENQKIDEKRLKNAIKDRTKELIYTMPKHLWD